MKNIALTIAALGLTVSGCASSSSGIVADYTSPMLYQNYTCQQLAIENQSLASHVARLRGQVDHAATNDKVMTGVGVVLFWPALFFIKGDGEAASEYAEMKGQHEAINQAFIMKNCGNASMAAATTPANVPGWTTTQGGWSEPPSVVERVH